MPLVDLTLAQFAAEVRGKSPAPGGGSVAALSGCMGASLVAMVCRLTAGKPAYAEHDAETLAVMAAADELSQRLLAAVDEDTAAYLRVAAAFRLPKDSDEQAAARQAAIQAATLSAAQVPLATAEACLDVLELVERLSCGYNTSAASDLGVAVQAALTGVRGAVLNVAINVPSLTDRAAAGDLAGRAAALQTWAEELAAGLAALVRAEVGGPLA
jgi:formiminotetrahydrofolate cyclodeaminase